MTIDFAIYCPTFNDGVVEYLGQVRNEPGAWLLAVVDHIPSEAVADVHQKMRLAEGRIRLIELAQAVADGLTDLFDSRVDLLGIVHRSLPVPGIISWSH
jgi:hypothetical protein